MKSKKIAIIGASIAGSAITIELQGQGHDVVVFERSKDTLQDRGAGIMLPRQLIVQLQQRDLIDSSFPFLSTSNRHIYAYDDKKATGRFLTEHPLLTAAINWQILYLNLIKRIPRNTIKYNSMITEIEQLDDGVKLKVNDSDLHYFDFVICADGYDSLGRKYLFPILKPEFSNCIIWRGTLEKIDPEISEYLLNNAAFHVCENCLMILYLIPNLNTNNPESNYIINWAIYEKITKKHPLYRSEQYIQNISKREMTPALLKYLHKMMVNFPRLPERIVLETQDPFIQAVYDVVAPRYAVNNICLLGDAAALLRPHVASGATKALQDAIALSECIEHNNDDFIVALEEWDKTQRQATQQLFQLGRRIGDLFVLKAPDWRSITKEQIDSYWEKTIGGYEWYAMNK